MHAAAIWGLGAAPRTLLSTQQASVAHWRMPKRCVRTENSRPAFFTILPDWDSRATFPATPRKRQLYMPERSMAEPEDEYWTKKELARKVKCSERTIDRLIETGDAPPVTRLSCRRI